MNKELEHQFVSELENNQNIVHKVCSLYTNDRDSHNDLFQEITIQLWKAYPKFRGDAKFSTWMYRVAVNAAHDWRRRAGTRAKAAEGWGDWEIARRADAEETRAAQDWLTQAMNALPGDLRETLALILDDEMTHAQAAAVLDISEGTVSWRMSEIRKRLREMQTEEARP